MTSLGFLARPDKIWSLLDSVAENVKTDFPLTKMKSIADAISDMEIENTEQVVFDTSNYLYSTRSELGAYILLPNTGDYSEIHKVCQKNSCRVGRRCLEFIGGAGPAAHQGWKNC